MKIALVTDFYDPSSLPAELPAAVRFAKSPYAAVFVRDLAEHLSALLSVEILIPARYMFSLRHPLRSMREFRALGEVSKNGPVKERFRFWKCRAALCRRPLDLLACRREARALDLLVGSAPAPDIIHAHFTFPAGCAAAMVARKRGIPYVITAHESYLVELLKRPVAGRLVRRALFGARRITVPSNYQRQRLLKALPQLEERTLVVPNGVNTDLFTCRERVSVRAPARLAFVGNLVAIKNLPILLRAAWQLAGEGFDFELRIAGTGHLRSQLEAAAAPLGGSVRFLGALDRNEVAELLRNTDVLILPSRTETFGVVLIEALASGVPVVATRCGGPEEIVTPEVGRLVQVGNPTELTAAIKGVCCDLAAYPRATLAAYARERFSLEAVAGRLASVYEEVLA
jgi:glycosyltransferase involved in cell wall biosynthesis